MRGVSPSQTLPFAGGQPPTPPGSVSPLHHDQRPALDPFRTLRVGAAARRVSQDQPALPLLKCLQLRLCLFLCPPDTTPPVSRPRPRAHPCSVSVSVPGRSRCRVAIRRRAPPNADEPAQGTPARPTPTEDAGAGIIVATLGPHPHTGEERKIAHKAAQSHAPTRSDTKPPSTL